MGRMAVNTGKQVFVPSSVAGRMTLVSSSVTGTISPEDAQRVEEENRRRFGVQRRRLYYSGTQFEEANQVEGADCAPGDPDGRVPEHRRLHAYSTQIQECVDFMSNRLGAGFSIDAADKDVKDTLHDMIKWSDKIFARDEDGDVEAVTDDVLREALIAGDTPVYVGWDPVEETPYLEFWECEAVEFIMANRSTVEKVIRYDVVWAEEPLTGTLRQVEERVVYEMRPNTVGIMECVAETWQGTDEEPSRTQWLGVGRIPWGLLKADAKGLRSVRGESLITDQAMDTADRYNAVEQTGYLIARYNSHSNVAVIGDAASLKLESDGRVSKDVADVLTFPGGTALQVLSLPTSPEMIEHQREVLAEALHSVFGVTRVDATTIQGLGQVSGYALEILNQKSEATFSRVSRNWRRDWYTLLDLVLDIVAWKREAVAIAVNPETGDEIELAVDEDGVIADVQIPEGWTDVEFTDRWWDVDPAIVFPNRKIKIRVGTGYVVDDVKVRDDFVAELISREEALRKRGYDDPTIKQIIRELDAQADKAIANQPEVGLFTGGPTSNIQTGSTLAAPVVPTEPAEQ